MDDETRVTFQAFHKHIVGMVFGALRAQAFVLEALIAKGAIDRTFLVSLLEQSQPDASAEYRQTLEILLAFLEGRDIRNVTPDWMN